MSRRNRKAATKEVVAEKVAGDATRDATTSPLAPTPKGGGGGSVFNSAMLTEGTYLQPTGLTFVESPFGQRFLSRKTRAMSRDDIVARGQVWAFKSDFILGYGSATYDIPDATGPYQLWLDWYSLVRDMGKRSLKYKHLPLTLATYPNIPTWWTEAYFVVLANLTMLGNLNRLPMVNVGLSALAANLPVYMARISRLWRRLSAIPAPTLFKAHAIRNGMIPFNPNYTCPVIRAWTMDTLLASASGGPTRTNISGTLFEILMDSTKLGTFVSNLESIERWLETGTDALSTDFTAFKDIVDMTADVVPGTWSAGLPDMASLPGVVNDPNLINEVYCRAIHWKDDQTTDKWGVFPIAAEANFGGRLPIAGFGAPHPMYDFTLFGAPKFGHFNDGVTRLQDVDGIWRSPGSDMPVFVEHLVTGTFNTREIFGALSGDSHNEECMLRDGSSTPINVYNAADWNSASGIRTLLESDSMKSKHIWADVMPQIRDSFIDHVWPRFVDEARFQYIFWVEAPDLCLNTTTVLAQALGIPYIRSSTAV